MKYLALSIVLVFVVGAFTGYKNPKTIYYEADYYLCLNGVSYISISGGIAPTYTPEGELVRCSTETV